jgi:hypothetical protein
VPRRGAQVVPTAPPRSRAHRAVRCAWGRIRRVTFTRVDVFTVRLRSSTRCRSGASPGTVRTRRARRALRVTRAAVVQFDRNDIELRRASAAGSRLAVLLRSSADTWRYVSCSL